MKIMYKQLGQDVTGSLNRLNIQNCYLKKLYIEKDGESITNKMHHHTEFELHIVTDGYQEYDVQGKKYILKSGSCLLIYPNIPHSVVISTVHTQKYSITFSKPVNDNMQCFFCEVPKRVIGNLEFVSGEAALKKEISDTLIENSILEILVCLFRLSGLKENDNTAPRDDNITVTLAKRFIEDNLLSNPGVNDVAKYCHFSTKQMTRIFRRFEGMSLLEYIVKRRISKIEELLTDDSMSLKKISTDMNFNNEYYFNTFFKKHSGMSPGEYRKMFGK